MVMLFGRTRETERLATIKSRCPVCAEKANITICRDVTRQKLIVTHTKYGELYSECPLCQNRAPLNKDTYKALDKLGIKCSKSPFKKNLLFFYLPIIVIFALLYVAMNVNIGFQLPFGGASSSEPVVGAWRFYDNSPTNEALYVNPDGTFKWDHPFAYPTMPTLNGTWSTTGNYTYTFNYKGPDGRSANQDVVVYDASSKLLNVVRHNGHTNMYYLKRM
jgi:hypothetical protein